MNKKLLMIKLTYGVGIIVDGVWAVALFFPRLYGLLIKKNDFNPDLETRLIMIIAASLMSGWTLLLIWALLKPIERRFVLFMSALVVLGICTAPLMSALNGSLVALLLFAKTLLILIFLIFSFIAANKIAADQVPLSHDRQ